MYKQKYLKYKKKYLNLKSQIGGVYRDAQPAATLPETQSEFFMPIISEAYHIAKGNNVPDQIIKETGRIIKLKGMNEPIYIIMRDAVVEYLKIPANLANLEKFYNADGGLPASGSSHIKAEEQENILQAILDPSSDFGLDVHATLSAYIGEHYASR